jgi:DNA-binding response OmpR family regulator
MPTTLNPRTSPPPAADRQPAPTPQLAVTARATRILLVEDEPLTAEVFARALAREGHVVEVASDGRQALRQLRDRQPHLLILDMSLPTGSGTEIVRWLRQEGHRDLPVLVVSGSPRTASALTSAELWPGTWIDKPVKPRHLVALVREFLRPVD